MFDEYLNKKEILQAVEQMRSVDASLEINWISSRNNIAYSLYTEIPWGGSRKCVEKLRQNNWLCVFRKRNSEGRLMQHLMLDLSGIPDDKLV